jgi:hypothetical protein
MMTLRKSILIRILLSMVVGILVASVVTEVGFHLQGNTISRPPKTVTLVIPNGTSAKVAQGENVIPSDMIFVVGDTLLVRNEDSVTHTLGPMIVPAGSSTSLMLDQAKNLVYTCSFETQKIFGIDVHEALTLSTRIQGFLLAGIPMGLLLALYSLVAWPLKSKNNSP